MRIRYERVTLIIDDHLPNQELSNVTFMRTKMNLTELQRYGESMPGTTSYEPLDGEGYMVYYPLVFQGQLTLQSADVVTLLE